MRLKSSCKICSCNAHIALQFGTPLFGCWLAVGISCANCSEVQLWRWSPICGRVPNLPSFVRSKFHATEHFSPPQHLYLEHGHFAKISFFCEVRSVECLDVLIQCICPFWSLCFLEGKSECQLIHLDNVSPMDLHDYTNSDLLNCFLSF